MSNRTKMIRNLDSANSEDVHNLTEDDLEDVENPVEATDEMMDGKESEFGESCRTSLESS